MSRTHFVTAIVVGSLAVAATAFAAQPMSAVGPDPRGAVLPRPECPAALLGVGALPVACDAGL